MKDISSVVPLSGLVLLLLFAFMFFRSVRTANGAAEELKKLKKDRERRDEQLKKEAQEVVRLAHDGDPTACAVIARHLGDPKNSDFQGLIDIGVDGKPVFTDSSKSELEWHILTSEGGDFEVKKLPRTTAVWEPSQPASLR
jgi:hypothetical protein